MRKITHLILLMISTCTVLVAQERYLTPIAEDIHTETQTYVSKDGQNLELDIYMPEYDAETKRATLIYVHGGGFQVGTRNSEEIQEFCTKLTRYGYVVASISYRLTRKNKPGGFGCECPANEKLNTFYAAVEDLQDAAFFLIQHREEFGIDPQRIILAGSSAGAETVLNAAYQPPYCYGLDSGPVSFSGVIGMAGAIPDTTVIYNESAIPSLLFHGTDDELVPYGTAPHHYCAKGSPGYLILNGSKTITAKLAKLNVPFWLHTTCGAGHEMAHIPMTKHFDDIVDFCYHHVVKQDGESRYTIVNGDQITDNNQPINTCTE